MKSDPCFDSIVSAGRAGGATQNLKIINKPGGNPAGYFCAHTSPPAWPGFRPACNTIPGQNTPYTAARALAMVPAAAMPAVWHAITRGYSAIKPVAPLYGHFTIKACIYIPGIIAPYRPVYAAISTGGPAAADQAGTDGPRAIPGPGTSSQRRPCLIHARDRGRPRPILARGGGAPGISIFYQIRVRFPGRNWEFSKHGEKSSKNREKFPEIGQDLRVIVADSRWHSR